MDLKVAGLLVPPRPVNSMLYNFIIPDTSEYSLDELRDGDLADFWKLYCQGEFTWALQTYHVLKKCGLPLELSHALDPDAVNLVHGNLLKTLPKRVDCYCVSLQADYPHFPLAQYHIVQNKAQLSGKSSFVPCWPQIGQRSRDPNRTAVTRMAYQGALDFTDLDQEQINLDLQEEGITFELLDAARWRDLEDVDVLIGIRSFGTQEYKRKPPSKLINAWHAGIPFIGGWDSAYSQIGIPGEDYLRVASYEEMIRKIIELKNNPILYQWMVRVGRKRATEYTFDSIAQMWREPMEGEIARDFEAWNKMSTKAFRYRFKLLGYLSAEAIKRAFRGFYRIPAIKRLRDLHYDPVR